ncbi:hypothetical protein CDD82_7662 [Ophiocordyceps australis]|uniref:Uncharacterized protein n=1 Tax=Ophiocordyceps australis TaxID=1399860 RepID=A0A2C5YPP4_9HYPO|nr:hypothetical protein CDD82_7662 [Ophiocordyceps australis]
MIGTVLPGNARTNIGPFYGQKSHGVHSGGSFLGSGSSKWGSSKWGSSSGSSFGGKGKYGDAGKYGGKGKYGGRSYNTAYDATVLKTNSDATRPKRAGFDLDHVSPGSLTSATTAWPGSMPHPQPPSFQPPPPLSWQSQELEVSSAAAHHPQIQAKHLNKAPESTSALVLQTIRHELNHVRHELREAVNGFRNAQHM